MMRGESTVDLLLCDQHRLTTRLGNYLVCFSMTQSGNVFTLRMYVSTPYSVSQWKIPC